MIVTQFSEALLFTGQINKTDPLLNKLSSQNIESLRVLLLDTSFLADSLSKMNIRNLKIWNILDQITTELLELIKISESEEEYRQFIYTLRGLIRVQIKNKNHYNNLAQICMVNQVMLDKLSSETTFILFESFSRYMMDMKMENKDYHEDIDVAMAKILRNLLYKAEELNVI